MSSPVSLPITGSCGCGAVRFEISEPLVSSVYCHCTRCQRRSGAGAPASARVVPGSVRLQSGEDRIGSWFAGSGRDKVFCADCGSALFARTPGTDEIVAVRLGAIDGDPGIRPSARQYVNYAAPWEPIPDDELPRFPERAPG